MDYLIRKHLIKFQKNGYGNVDYKDFQGIDCSLGANPFGCTPKGYQQKIDPSLIMKYPHSYDHLKLLLCDYWAPVFKTKIDNIRFGNGSMNVLENINEMFLDPHSKVLGYCPQFPEYMLDVNSCNADYRYLLMQEKDNFKFNGNEFLEKINEGFELIYIDNPNNPTGQIIPLDVLEKIIGAAARRRTGVIIDEAYGEYMPKESSAISLIGKYHNLMVARSFSKGFGLPGLRTGYVMASEDVLQYYDKITNIFPLSVLTEPFLSAALEDRDFIEASCDEIFRAKREICKSCHVLRILETSKSVPIFILMHPDQEVNLYDEFKKRGVLTVSGKSFIGLRQNSVRVCVPKEYETLINAIDEIEKTYLANSNKGAYKEMVKQEWLKDRY